MATLNRWSPFEEALSLRDAMSRLFEESFVAPQLVRGGNLGIEMNVHEHANGFSIEAAVPGIKAEDLDVTLQDNVLTITGEFRQEKPAEGTTVHRTERRYGRFSRSIALPTQVQSDNIAANLENGILRLEIPKAEEVKPRKINVQLGPGTEQRTLEAGK